MLWSARGFFVPLLTSSARGISVRFAAGRYDRSDRRPFSCSLLVKGEAAISWIQFLPWAGQSSWSLHRNGQIRMTTFPCSFLRPTRLRTHWTEYPAVCLRLLARYHSACDKLCMCMPNVGSVPRLRLNRSNMVSAWTATTTLRSGALPESILPLPWLRRKCGLSLSRCPLVVLTRYEVVRSLWHVNSSHPFSSPCSDDCFPGNPDGCRLDTRLRHLVYAASKEPFGLSEHAVLFYHPAA